MKWDPSPDKTVTGYLLHLGTAPGSYDTQINVGNRTDYELILPGGTYYAAVRAYADGGQSSPFSNEILITVDSLAPRERSRSDWNGDGMADVLWRHRKSGYLAAWLLDGPTVRIESGLSQYMPDTAWEVVGTGDFNGDGRPDLLWRHKTYGYLAAWFMHGLSAYGVVSLSVPQVADTAWKIAAVGDITGDGKADILWQHDTGPLALWRMDGTTSVQSIEVIGDPATIGDLRWRVVAIADMNGDGHMDLVWQHSTGLLATWLMARGNVFGVQSLDPVKEPDPKWRIVGSLDLDLDGKQDLLWHHVEDGRVVVWYMDGLKRRATVQVNGGSIAGPDWQVVGPK